MLMSSVTPRNIRPTPAPVPATASTVSERPLDVKASDSYSAYKTAEERAAFIKQQAEQRMSERLAALGLKAPSKSGESLRQRQEREAKERQERITQAEREDQEREAERKRRVAEEEASARTAKKPPPTPPTRGTRADSFTTSSKDPLLAEREGMEKAVKDQQAIQAVESQALEWVHFFAVLSACSSSTNAQMSYILHDKICIGRSQDLC